MAVPSLDDLGPGLHVMRDAGAPARAVAIADALDAELCETADQADALLEDRRRVRTVDVGDLVPMHTLARRLQRAERLAARTLGRAVADAGARLSGSIGLAVHPDTVRERAARLESARAELVAAERAVAAHETSPPPTEAAVEAAPFAGDAPTPRPAGSGGGQKQAIGTVVAGFGVGLILFAMGVPLWTVLIAPLAASLWALRLLGREDEAPAPEEGNTLLSEVGTFTDELFGARHAQRAHEVEAARLEVARSRAEEEVRVAQRAWAELAGDAGPDEVDAVVRRFDPQADDARVIAEASVGVRAADLARQQLQGRWHELWERLDRPAPAPESAEAAVHELRVKLTRPIVLVGPAVARAADLAEVLPSATVIAVEDGERVS